MAVTQPGRSFPLGATVYPEGVNFSVYSKNANYIELLLFDSVEDIAPSHKIKLDRLRNRTFPYWHVFVPGLHAGQIYAYRAHGPSVPSRGLRFDGSKTLLDPYGRCIGVPKNFQREAVLASSDAVSMKNIVADLSHYDWEGDIPLRRPFEQTVIYEMHVGGFTKHESSGVAPHHRGTYLGLIEKIPFLKDLGITAVELLPVFHFDAQEAPTGLTNYWGYNPISFFAPHQGYSSKTRPLAALDEFRDMVKALHRAGIEVILDVVYNHTAEGNEKGPTYCFKGLENEAYYILGRNKERYQNFSGCGNTLNANHSCVRRMILDSLRYWVQEMHVDGFRFDLASILSRDVEGNPLANPPILWDIETDPILSGTKLIAEAWDAAGLYHVGNFYGDRWKEWNSHFRDDVRAFLKGDRGQTGNVASRFLASPDIYGHRSREPEQSVNFVTAHDGFTLNDLVTYNEKHNESNREQNRDGHNFNLSWNCGVEGPTDDPSIEKLRRRQIKNFFAINLISLGVPMIAMGDEVRRTQNGNNNAYCQDNELSWFDWNLPEKNPGILRFVKQLIRFRLSLPIHNSRRHTLIELLHKLPIQWHGTKLNEPDWGHHSHVVAFSVQGKLNKFCFILNAYWKALEFELPAPSNSTNWRRIIDTYQESPDDFNQPDNAPFVDSKTLVVQPRTVVALMS